LLITCRGLAVGASGEIDLSGDDGSLGGMYSFDAKGYYSGSGAAGGPGTLQCLLDGDSLSYPVIAGAFRARVGLVPQPTSPAVEHYLDTTDIVRRSTSQNPYGGYNDPRLISNIDLAFSCFRVQNAPGVEAITPDADDVPPPITNLITIGLPNGVLVVLALPTVATFDAVEIWAGATNDRNLAARVMVGLASEFRHIVATNATMYYWAFTVKDGVPSPWFPLSSTAGVAGTAIADPNAAIVLIPRGNSVVDGTNITKVGGASAYDSDCYSREAYLGGCALSFQAGQTDKHWLAGLNSDPLTDQNYTSLDFAWYGDNAAGSHIYENGSFVSSVGAYTEATQFEVKTDGAYVYYYKDGVLSRSVPSVGRRLFFDCSLYNPGTRINAVRFISAPTVRSTAGSFVARGNCVFGGDVIEKFGGSNAYDSDCYSLERYLGGCRLQFKAAQTNLEFLLGLNVDPTTDSSYTSLDFTFVCRATGLVDLFENGSGVATSIASYTTATQFELAYDGENVRYIIDGNVIRTVAVGLTSFFLDSSFYHPGAKAVDVRFFPMNENSFANDGAVVFLDTFEHKNWQARYLNASNGGGLAVTYPADGSLGGKVLHAAGGQLWIQSTANIPYDPNALYRITARVRRKSGSGSTQFCFVGVAGVAADGLTLINTSGSNDVSVQHYNCINGLDLGGVAVDTWVDGVGYFKGHATSGFGANSDSSTPTPLYTGVKYFRPLVILNYNGGTGTQQIDYIKVEKTAQTADIQVGATTEIYTASSAGPDNISVTAGGGIQVAWITSVTLTPTVACTATVRVVCDAISDLAGTTNALGVAARIERTTTPFTSAQSTQNPNSEIVTTASSEVQMSLLAGVEYKLGLRGIGYDFGVTNHVVSFTNSRTSVELIKR
jgi:hypothetical protein